MSKRIRVYAGVGFHGDDSPILPGERVAAIASIRDYASNTFGGVTVYNHDGSWSTNGEIVTEPGITIEVLYDTLGDGQSAAEKFARHVQSSLGQNTVVLTIENVDVRFVH